MNLDEEGEQDRGVEWRGRRGCAKNVKTLITISKFIPFPTM
jgi:hypothetical protein